MGAREKGETIMTVWISLLRGINVGGNKRIKMADLSALYESLGLAGVHTLLQSGNALFQSDEADAAALARRIEAGIEQRFGFHVDVFLRTRAQWRNMVGRNPFAGDSELDPARLLVTFLVHAPAADAVAALQGSHIGPEDVRASGAELFVYYPDGMGRSALSGAVIEKALKMSVTARNWRTVTRILELAGGIEGA